MSFRYIGDVTSELVKVAEKAAVQKKDRTFSRNDA